MSLWGTTSAGRSYWISTDVLYLVPAELDYVKSRALRLWVLLLNTQLIRIV